MKKQKIKLVVWDLDNTIWQGVLSEDKNVILTYGIKMIIEALDKRGILQSISSKNDFDKAYEKLREFGLEHYFLYPKINWNPKSQNIKETIKQINISEDTVAFVDDQAFELEEVNFFLPTITVIPAVEIDNILEKDCMNPIFITNDSKLRRSMYQSDIKRQISEVEFAGTKEEFLYTLQMEMKVSAAVEEDLKRAEELTVRTHQLNSTGYTYSYDELRQFIDDDYYKLWIVELTDIYGNYGKIGLILINCEEEKWTLKLLLTSCRVMSHGIGSVLLSLVINNSIETGKELLAEFVQTDQNRIMFVTYTMMGFQKSGDDEGMQLLKYNANKKYELPKYLKITDETGEKFM